jgi:glycosyltransferase involved in cell wall biosynthesis
MMHVPWNWIKQRPHFIAEELVNYTKITVLAAKSTKQNKLLTKNLIHKSITLLEPFSLPVARFALFRKLNTFILHLISIIYSLKNEIIWVPFPLNWRLLKMFINNKKIVIYDCMDDALAFPSIQSNKKLHQRYFNLERNLVERSNIIFSSSHHLAEKIYSRYNTKMTIHVINNAISPKIENYFNLLKTDEELNVTSKGYFDDNRIKIVYIGTVSEWFDWNTVIYALDETLNTVLYLFGPSEIKIPIHDRIIHVGPVPHDSIYAVMNCAKLLIMPFLINELILSVNPVKLYEYIGSGIPSVAVRYAETEKLEEYVYLYSTKEEFCDYVSKLSDNNLNAKHSKSEAIMFLQDNIWSKRVAEMWKIIEDELFVQEKNDH